MHTIKGSSQLFGFSQIGTVAHAMESSLDPLRQEITPLNLNLVDIIYRGCDIIGRLVASIKETQAEHDAMSELTEIIPKLIDITVAAMGGITRFLRDDFVGFDIRSPSGAKTETPAPQLTMKAEPAPSPAEPATVQVEEDAPLVTPSPVETQAPQKSEPIAPQSVAPSPAPAQASPAPEPVPTPAAPIEEKKAESKPSPSPKETAPKPAATPKAADKPAAKEKKADSSGQETIRVQVALLDKLMNLAGELVLVRNQVLRFASEQKDSEFSKLSQRINLVTTEIQNEVMKMRMQPVGSVLSKFHRVVRDLAKELNKKIELKLEGTETELDKTLIEAVKDPLTHIVEILRIMALRLQKRELGMANQNLVPSPSNLIMRVVKSLSKSMTMAVD